MSDERRTSRIREDVRRERAEDDAAARAGVRCPASIFGSHCSSASPPRSTDDDLGCRLQTGNAKEASVWRDPASNKDWIAAVLIGAAENAGREPALAARPDPIERARVPVGPAAIEAGVTMFFGRRAKVRACRRHARFPLVDGHGRACHDRLAAGAADRPACDLAAVAS